MHQVLNSSTLSRHFLSQSILYNRFFSDIAKNLNAPIRLRVAFCGTGDADLPSSMDALIEAVRSNYGEVDIAPKMKFISKILKKPVTNLSKSWLSKSIN